MSDLNTFADIPAYTLQRYNNRVYASDTSETYAHETALPLEVVKAMDTLADYFVARSLVQLDTPKEYQW